MRLRYYADSSYEDDHETVLALLERIYDEWEIPVEIVRIRERHGPIDGFPGDITGDSIEAAFEADFEYNRTLATNTGHTPADAYQTKSGLITIAGCVGIVDGDLEWATMLSGEPPDTHRGGVSDTYTISFLRRVLEEGRPSMEAKLESETVEEEASETRDVLQEFVATDHVEIRPSGTVSRETTVGTSTAQDTDLSVGADRLAREMGSRTVDGILEGAVNWVIQVKEEFTATTFDTAIGEVVVADWLYRATEDLPATETTPAILFGGVSGGVHLPDDPDLLAQCGAIAADLGVEVFVGFEPEEIGTQTLEFVSLSETERLQRA